MKTKTIVTCILLILCLIIDTGHRICEAESVSEALNETTTIANGDTETETTTTVTAAAAPGEEEEEATTTGDENNDGETDSQPSSRCTGSTSRPLVKHNSNELKKIIAIMLKINKTLSVDLKAQNNSIKNEKKEPKRTTTKEEEEKEKVTEVITVDKIKTLPKSGKRLTCKWC